MHKKQKKDSNVIFTSKAGSGVSFIFARTLWNLDLIILQNNIDC